MKLSVSLSPSDVEALDDFVRSAGLPSRSAAVQRAIKLLRLPDLEQDYASAWDDWRASGEQETWDDSLDDGLTDAAR